MIPKKILLVEDNIDDIDLTLRAFHKSKLANEIVVISDGAEALDYVFCRGKYSSKTPEPLPALILLDINLPKMNGFEILDQIRLNQKTKYIPVVILSSSNEEHDIAKSYESGANSYVKKPVNFKEFMDAVNKLGQYWLLVNEPVEIPKGE